jgi:hypothetical protein
MARAAAIKTAYVAFMIWLRTGQTAYGLTHRYREGRWDIYSLDVSGWHILLSDNGGRLVSAVDCSHI